MKDTKQTINNPQLDSGELNFLWAYKLIHSFSQLGVTQAVISPGSRSTPLALACEKHPKIETWIQIDERSAGFFALGLSQRGLSQNRSQKGLSKSKQVYKQSTYKQQPTILICTSGSAVANWFPAVIEAEHSYTPLLLLSADRPIELQNCGANQTINQHKIFGVHVVDFIPLKQADEILFNQDYLQQIAKRAYNNSQRPKMGVVHINIPFREPLLPSYPLTQLIKKITTLESNKFNIFDLIINPKIINPDSLVSIAHLLTTGKGLIICGRLTTNEQTDLLPLLGKLVEKLHCPILLDPLSNFRFIESLNQYAIYNYDYFLKYCKKTTIKQLVKVSNNISTSPLLPDWIIRLGQFPVSKNLMEFLKELKSETILVNSFAEQLDPIHKATRFLHCSAASFCEQILALPLMASPTFNPTPSPDVWLNLWKQYDKQAENTITNSLENANPALKNKLFEGHVINTLLKHIPNYSLLFSGNSMAIRDFDTFITQSSCHGKSIDFYANRGASGIDGNLSTFLGLLTNHKAYAVIMLGDLSFYHDMNSLLICRELARKGYNATILLINNSGGGIFNYLPLHQLDEFDRLWNTDTQLDFQYSAKLYALNYTKVEKLCELESKLANVMQQSGFQLLEVIIDQQISVQYHSVLNDNDDNV